MEWGYEEIGLWDSPVHRARQEATCKTGLQVGLLCYLCLLPALLTETGTVEDGPSQALAEQGIQTPWPFDLFPSFPLLPTPDFTSLITLSVSFLPGEPG